MTHSTKDTMRTLTFAGALLAALATPVHGQITRIDETRPLRDGQAVDIEVISHTLVVEGWDRNEIQIVGEYDRTFEEMEIDEDPTTFSFEIDQLEDQRRGRGRRGTETRLDIKVPRGAQLNLETVSGIVTVTGFTGALEASSVSGRVEVTGNLDLAELESVSGRVRYAGDSPFVRLESVSGNVDYTGIAGYVGLESVSGAVLMDGGAETIEAESVSGPVRLVSSVAVSALDASSVSGPVSFRGRFASGARADVESHSGPVDLLLAGATDAEFELESFSGSVDATLADMRDIVRNRSRMTPSESMRFATGSGAGRLSASSFSGSVRITEAR